MLKELFPELLLLVFDRIKEEQDIVTLVRLRLTCWEYNDILNNHKMVLPTDIPLIIRHGHIKIMEHIADDELFSESSISEAIRYDQSEVIEWLHERTVPISLQNYKRAVYHGKFQVLEYLLTIPKGTNLTEIWQRYKLGHNAIYGQRVDVLEWAYQKGLTLTSSLYEAAVFVGCVDIIDWLKVHNCPIDKSILDFKGLDMIEDKLIDNILL